MGLSVTHFQSPNFERKISVWYGSDILKSEIPVLTFPILKSFLLLTDLSNLLTLKLFSSFLGPLEAKIKVQQFD